MERAVRNFRRPSAGKAGRALPLFALVLLLIGLVVALPASTLAQGGEEPQPQPEATPFPPPPRLDPPAQGPGFNPHPGRSVDQLGLHGAANAVEFEPQLRVTLGESPQPPAGESAGLSVEPGADGGGLIGPQGVAGEGAQTNVLQAGGWNLRGGESFEGAFGPGVSCDLSGGSAAWRLLDQGPDGFDRTWGQDSSNPLGGEGKSAWPAAGGKDKVDPQLGNYPDNLESWMICGPFDFSTAADVYADFWLWMDIELHADWFYFGASIDNQTFDVAYWSGDSGGWTYQPFWLTGYAGYSQVWLAWIFESDGSNPQSYPGAWVDDISIWSYDVQIDPNGNLAQNGSFEDGGQGWSVYFGPPAVNGQVSLAGEVGPANSYITDLSSVDGKYSALIYADGELDDFLYQTFKVPAGTTDVQFNFWFAVTTNETSRGADWFCASLADFSDPQNPTLVVDLGCLDAAYSTGVWQEVIYTLSLDEVADALTAGNVSLVFELYNRGASGTGTAAWIDFVRFYATGGEAGAHVDGNEPNDDPASATALDCGATANGTIGDVYDGYGDEDWFRLDNVPQGRIDLNIDARTLSPPSELDSVIYLYDSDQTTLLDSNDDDGTTYDSYLVYTNTVNSSATYYVNVVSYDGYGSADHFYQLKVDCADTGSGPDMPPTPPGGQTNTWTLMLYLNAEDKSFEQTLLKYIDDLEKIVKAKNNPVWLNITVLYDGPGSGDTVRYRLQPDGMSYTNGVNRWPLSEQNLGDRDTLAAFVKWSMDTYPAEKYYLAIDDHGHGVYGISWDKTNGNDSLTPPEIYSALKEATLNGQRKIDIFDYEACLMGMAENAYDVKDWVDYVTFSEQISWGLDTYPQYFSDLMATDTPVTVGTRIVDRYNTQANNAGYPHTISLIDTGRMADVKRAVTALGDALVATGNKNAVTAARNNAQAFAADNDATNPLLADYVDLWDLADKTAGLTGVNSVAAQVKAAVTNAVVTEKHVGGTIDGFNWDHSGARGLSIYYPAVNSSSAFSNYVAQRLFKMTLDESGIEGRWDEFLKWAVTETGNGAGNGLGGGDRKGMTGARFLQPKLGGTKFIYLPFIVKQ